MSCSSDDNLRCLHLAHLWLRDVWLLLRISTGSSIVESTSSAAGKGTLSIVISWIVLLSIIVLEVVVLSLVVALVLHRLPFLEKDSDQVDHSWLVEHLADVRHAGGA